MTADYNMAGGLDIRMVLYSYTAIPTVIIYAAFVQDLKSKALN